MDEKTKDIKNVRLFVKTGKGANYFEVRDGDEVLGAVGPVLGSLNRRTGIYCYEISGGRINWRAGHSSREAALAMVKKLGYS